MKIIFLFFVIVLLAPITIAQSWQFQKEKHFVIQYDESIDSQWAHEVLMKAESYYSEIGEKIGYSRYHDFWTWNERVNVVVYLNKDIFIQETHQPIWSKATVTRYNHLYKSRAIFTYFQQENFLEGSLPHEISHLIFRDYIGYDRNIPLWFEEGIAQLFEKDKTFISDRIIQNILKANQPLLTLDGLNAMDLKNESEALKIGLFYAQGVSIVHYLYENFGHDRFIRLCRDLRDKYLLEDAIKRNFQPSIRSYIDLEKKWLEYIQN